jgi:hypothetical protein
MRIPSPAICISALLMSGGAAVAAPGDAIGSAVTVVNYVTASLENAADERQLASGDDVRQQELIEVDQDSRSEIELNDRTKLALGPGARMLLDKFVYDPDLSGGAIVVNLLKGTFRFITGIAAKPAYVIRTPAASITVRGTIFDVFVINTDETWLLLSEGAVEACTESGKCLLHDEPGKIIRITRDDIDTPAKWANLRKRDIDFDDAFPFIVSPPKIDPDPVFSREDIVKVDEEDYPEDPPRDAKPAKVKPQKIEYEEPYTPPPRKVKIKREYREHRTYPREVHYEPKRRGRGREILKKGIKAGVAVGVGLGVGYGIAKVLRRKY